MGIKETLVIAFIVALFAHWCWCLYIAYPLVLDKCIERGQSWLYLPLKWKGLLKAVISVTTPILLLFVILLGTSAVWLYTRKMPGYFFVFFSLILAVIIFYLHSFCLKFRFRQQENSYFFIRGQLSQKMKSSGKKLSEMEINNLASFQHQNLLREADIKGKLKEALVNQSALAKRSRKAKKVKSS